MLNDLTTAEKVARWSVRRLSLLQWRRTGLLLKLAWQLEQIPVDFTHSLHA